MPWDPFVGSFLREDCVSSGLYRAGLGWAIRIPRRGSTMNSQPRHLTVVTASVPNRHAQVVELVDALASGASGLTAVKVRVLSWAPPPTQVVEIAHLQGI